VIAEQANYRRCEEYRGLKTELASRLKKGEQEKDLIWTPIA
jgi:hypothetical protein